MRAGIELPSEPDPGGPAMQTGPSRFNDAEVDSPEADARQKVKDFIWLSRRRFMTADSASSTFRNEMRRDQRFASGGGNQWETEDRQARGDEGRPCIEINRIPQFIRQVSNQNRANRSSIQLHARGKGSTVDLANAMQALIRGIETESDADVAYDTATTHQLISGLGFTGLMAKWADDEAFEQVARIRRLRNPLSVFWDPSTQEADFADCRWMHVVGAIGRDEYESRWGRVSPYATLTDYLTGQYQLDDWMPEGKIMVVEYYYVELEERNLLRMESGQNVWEPELEKFQAMFALSHPGQPLPQVVRSRMVDKRVVRWALHNGIDILAGNKERTAGREMPGTRIPLFPLMGDELDIDGQVDYRGMVRDARHPQQMYNYWSSSIAEAVALAPKAPWVAAKGQVDRYLNDWKNANRVPKALLTYDPVAVGDTLVPPPQRTAVGADIGAMVQGLAEANQDLMSVMGLFEPSLGQRGSPSESGKAREALQQQGVIANSNFLDNLQRMKRSIGRALLEWIPVIYDTPRLVHLIQPDGKKKPAVIYSGAQNKPQDGEFPDITDMYDVSVNAFDVTVSTGPSFQNQREATQAWLLDLFKIVPGLAGIGVDVLLENSDDPAAKQLALRAKKALPPQMQDENDPESELPMLQAKVQQQDQLLKMANQAIGSMSKALEGKELESDTKKQVAMIQANAALAAAQAKIGSTESIAAFQAESARFAQMVDQIQAQTVTGMEQDHQNVQQALGHANKVKEIEHQRESDTQMAVTNAALTPEPKPGAAGNS